MLRFVRFFLLLLLVLLTGFQALDFLSPGPLSLGSSGPQGWIHALTLAGLVILGFLLGGWRPSGAGGEGSAVSESIELANYHYALDASAVVVTTDLEGRILDCNDKFTKLSGYTKEEILGQSHGLLNSGYHNQEFFQNLWETIRSGRVWKGEIRNRAKDGHFYWLDTTIIPLLDEMGDIYRYLSIRFDITPRHQAYRELANKQELAHAIARAHEAYMAKGGKREIFNPLLMRVLSLTGARDGLIAQVRKDHLEALAFSSREWAKECFGMQEERLKGDLPIFAESLQSLKPGFLEEGEHYCLPFGPEPRGLLLLSGNLRGFQREFVESLSSLGPALLSLIDGIRHQERRKEDLLRLETSLAERNRLIDKIPELILELDSKGNLLRVKPARYGNFQAFEPCRPGRSLLEVLPQDKGEELLNHLKEVVGQAKAMSLELELAEEESYEMSLLSMGTNLLALVRDVSEQKRTERYLIAAKEEALTAKSMKDDFISNITHELKTPLTIILGDTELILESIDDFEKDQMREFLDDIFRSGRHLLRLIEDLLELNRIDRGTFWLERSMIDLAELVKESVERMRPLAEKKGLSLSFQSESAPLMIDVPRIQKVLMNLIGNAIKFSKEGRVEVQARLSGPTEISAEGSMNHLQEKPEAILSVRDQGVGIPNEDLQKIFQVFQQADGSSTRAFGGTGLGLAIAAKILERHGGGIQVESTPGEGSLFTLRLPLAPKPEEAQTERKNLEGRQPEGEKGE